MKIYLEWNIFWNGNGYVRSCLVCFTISFLELTWPRLFGVLVFIFGMVGWHQDVDEFALLFSSIIIPSMVPANLEFWMRRYQQQTWVHGHPRMGVFPSTERRLGRALSGKNLWSRVGTSNGRYSHSGGFWLFCGLIKKGLIGWCLRCRLWVGDTPISRGK